MSKSDDKPKPVPARKPATRSSSGDKKRSGPTMKERLLAQRREAEQAAAAQAAPKQAGSARASKPVAKAGNKPVTRRPKAPAAGKVAGARPGTVRRGAAKGTEEDGASPKRGSKRRHGNRADGDEFVGGGRRDLKPAPRKSPLPFIGIVVVLSAGIFGAIKYLDKGDGASAAETADTNTADVGSSGVPLDASGTEGAGAAAGEGATNDPEIEATPKEDPEPEPEKPKKPKKPISEMTDADYDPSEISYAELEVFGPATGTTDDEWKEIKRLVVTFTDPDAGAAGNRAGKKLETEYKEKAFPALVNAMMKLDLRTDEGHRTGDVIQKRLQFISNGKNAGWKYERDEWPNRTARYNRKVVVLLHKVWTRAKDDPAYWATYANLDEAEAPAAADEDAAASDDELDDLDDLDDL